MVASEHKSTAYHGPGIRRVVMGVYEAIRDRGVHDPVCHGFRGARELIQSVERHEILGELVRAYFANLGENPAEGADR